MKQCLCDLLPVVPSFPHVGCTDPECFGRELVGAVIPGWGLCCRCSEGTCFPQNIFSHLVPSLEALGSSALDYISHIIPYLITLSTLLPNLQPFLSPPALSHPPASSLPLQPSLSAFLLSALFASHRSIPQTVPFCRWTGPVTHGSPWGAGSQQASRALFLLLSLR